MFSIIYTHTVQSVWYNFKFEVDNVTKVIFVNGVKGVPNLLPFFQITTSLMAMASRLTFHTVPHKRIIIINKHKGNTNE